MLFTYCGLVFVRGASAVAPGVTRGVVVDPVRPTHGRKDQRVTAALRIAGERQVRSENIETILRPQSRHQTAIFAYSPQIMV